MQEKIKIFVSSVFGDDFQSAFSDERKAIKKFCKNEPDKFEDISLSSEPDFNIGSEEKSLEVLRTSDLVILLIGSKYGRVRYDNLSMTRIEYRHALENDIPILIYVFDQDEKHPDYQRVKDFLLEIDENDRRIYTMVNSIFPQYKDNVLTYKANKIDTIDNLEDKIEEFSNNFALHIKDYINAHREEVFSKYNKHLKDIITVVEKRKIRKAKSLSDEEKQRVEKKFYFIDDSYKTIFDIVSNDLDVINKPLMHKLHSTFDSLNNSAFWLLGNGGEGKSTTLLRLAIENTLNEKSSFYMDLENPSLKRELIPDILKFIQYNTKNKAHIFIDNPDINIEFLESFFKYIYEVDFDYVVVLAERKNRYNFLKEHNKNAIYIHGQTQNNNSILLTIPKEIKEKVYKKFYAFLGVQNATIETLIDTTINQKNLAYVNATYKILYEL